MRITKKYVADKDGLTLNQRNQIWDSLWRWEMVSKMDGWFINSQTSFDVDFFDAKAGYMMVKVPMIQLYDKNGKSLKHNKTKTDTLRVINPDFNWDTIDDLKKDWKRITTELPVENIFAA